MTKTTDTLLLQNMLKIPFNFVLFSRGVSLESCIVVQHVGGDSKNGGASPVSKKPCPHLKVCPYLKFLKVAYLTVKHKLPFNNERVLQLLHRI